MPATKTLTIKSAKTLAKKIAYLADGEAESHLEYTIEASHCDPASAARFVARNEDAIDALNRERSGSNQIRVRAYWLFSRFGDRSKLSAEERKYFEEQLLLGLGIEPDAPRAWHCNRLLGCADFNMLVSATRPGLLPQLRRWFAESLVHAARRLADAATQVINASRKATGTPLIAEMPETKMQRAVSRRGTSLEASLASAADKAKTPITVGNLAELLRLCDFEDDEFELSDGQLCVRGKRRHALRLRVRLQELILRARSLSKLHQIRLSQAIPTTPAKNPKKKDIGPSHDRPSL